MPKNQLITHLIILSFLYRIYHQVSTTAERCPSIVYCNCSDEDIIINNKTINQLNTTVFLNCDRIENANLFLNDLNANRIDNHLFLKINDTKYEIVDFILNNLNLDLKRNLAGLLLSNLTEIKERTFDFDLTNFNRLNLIQFTFNQFGHLNCAKFNQQLKQIDLSRNQLQSVYGCDLIGDFSQLTDLDLSKNNLTTLQLSGLKRLSKKITFNLKLNDWKCDQNLMPLINLVYESPSLKTSFLDEQELKCKSPKNLTNLQFRTLADIQATPICLKCDCHHIRNNILGLDCTNRGLSELPFRIPLSTKVVNLDYNSIKSLNFKKIDARSIVIWRQVIRFSIRHNQITSLDFNNFNVLEQMLEFNLTHNNLRSIPTSILKKMNNRDMKLEFGFNPWTCACNSDDIFKFQSFLRSKKYIYDLDNIKCNNQADDKPIYKLERNELCLKTNQAYYWNIANICLSISIALLLIKLIYDYIYKLKTSKLPYFFKLNC